MSGDLDQIDWGALAHAYGPADDLPGLFRDLSSGDDQKVDKAIDAFFGNIWHQGTVYSASAPAVAFVAKALDDVDDNRKRLLLDLLSCLATGHGYYDVHQHLAGMGELITSDLDDLDGTLERERQIVRDTVLAVFTQWDRIEQLLESDLEGLRCAAIKALLTLASNDASEPAAENDPAPYLGVRPEGTKGQWAARLLALAEEKLPQAQSPSERAAYRQVFVEIGPDDHPALSLSHFEHASAIERYVILWGNARQALAGQKVFAEPFADYIGQHARDLLNWSANNDMAIWPWEVPDPSEIYALCRRLSDPALDKIAPDIAALLAKTDTSFCGQDILSMILRNERPNIPDDPCNLPPGRRLLAQALVDAVPNRGMSFWDPGNGNAEYDCQVFDAPHEREKWVRWLHPKRRSFWPFQRDGSSS